MLTAILIRKCDRTSLHSRPVFIDDIQQPTMHKLTAPLDAIVAGVPLRLPVGTVISLTAGGSGGSLGRIESECEFLADDGERWRTQRGQQLRIPA